MSDKRDEQRQKEPQDGSRRDFLKVSGAAVGGLVVGGVIGGAIMGNRNKPGAPGAPGAPGTPAPDEQPSINYNQALMFFNQEQFQLTEAAAERIYPKDELGPGAKELGVAFFIDHQLASTWGYNAKEYMAGPFYKGEATQGNYPSIKRHELFTLGLRAMQDISQKKYQKSFLELSETEQDDILKLFEKGNEIAINGATSANFFNLLRTFTIEGVYADPLYGGNKDMMGWKMRNFPGNQMSYLNIIEQDQFAKIEPRSLHSHMAGH